MNNNKIKVCHIRSVNQLTIFQLIAEKTGLTIADVQDVIELEQKLTMDFIRRGRKVVKKNYLTLIPIVQKGKTFISPLDGNVYHTKNKLSVSVRIGDGFKEYINKEKNRGV